MITKINYPNSFIGNVHWSQISDYYSKAHVVVNYSINNDINLRIFEGVGAGALVITNRILNNGFEEIFEEGRHLVVFDDIFKEMVEKIDYYLKNREERKSLKKVLNM